MQSFNCHSLLLGLVAMIAGEHAVYAANILAITPIAAASHWNVMSSVLEVLVNRGHRITVVSPFPRKVPHENYTEIDLSKLVPFAIASPWDTVNIPKDYSANRVRSVACGTGPGVTCRHSVGLKKKRKKIQTRTRLLWI